MAAMSFAGFAAHMDEVIDADATRCDTVTYAQWRERPLRERIAERFSALFASQL